VVLVSGYKLLKTQWDEIKAKAAVECFYNHGQGCIEEEKDSLYIDGWHG